MFFQIHSFPTFHSLQGVGTHPGEVEKSVISSVRNNTRLVEFTNDDDVFKGEIEQIVVCAPTPSLHSPLPNAFPLMP